MTERVVRLLKRWAGAAAAPAGPKAPDVMAEMTESYASQVDELFDRIRSACPSFVPVDDAAGPGWQGEPRPAASIRIAGLSRHLARMAADGRPDLIQPILDLVEGALPGADESTRHLLIGFFGDLRNACLESDGRVRLVDVRTLLGPRSATAWDEPIRVWHGPPAETRRRLPPGSLPDDA